MSWSYDNFDYDPPAPVFDVFISAPGDPDTRIASVALLDTGADVSVLAPGLASQLGLPLIGQIQVAGVNERPESASVWATVIETPAGRFTVEAVEIGTATILGRDVLNRLSLHFDGPNLMVRPAR
jgi:predicted aspartyl protease